MKEYSRDELRIIAIEKLKERGVTLKDIGEIVLILQQRYQPELNLDICIENVFEILDKREVVYAILTGIALDELAEKELLPQPIQDIIASDYGLYGIDEIVPLSIVNIYGTIGLTNFGYLDKEKIGIIKKLDEEGRVEGKVNTFLDDIVAAIASATASRIAHQKI